VERRPAVSRECDCYLFNLASIQHECNYHEAVFETFYGGFLAVPLASATTTTGAVVRRRSGNSLAGGSGATPMTSSVCSGR
jgi:hypothetical protein